MIFVIFFRFLALAVRKFLKLRPLQWRNGEFDKVNHQVERQPSTSTRHLPNIKKIVRAVFQTNKIYLFAVVKENHPLQHFIRVLTQEKKHVRNFISKLTSFLQKLEISHYIFRCQYKNQFLKSMVLQIMINLVLSVHL